MKKIILGFLGGVYGFSRGILIILGLGFLMILLVAWLGGYQHINLILESDYSNTQTIVGMDNLISGNLPYILYGILIIFTVGMIATGIFYIVKSVQYFLKARKEEGKLSGKFFKWLKEN